MFTLTDPPDATVRRHLAALVDAPFSYPETDMTRPVPAAAGERPAPPADGYRADHYRQRLDAGDHGAWRRARDAVGRWAMFDGFSWLRLVRLNPDASPAAGAVVAVVARHLGFWSVNACRVVYVVDEPGRFGFAYGTLRGHAERGEERFLVERRAGADGGEETWFDLLALSQPGPLARLAAPLARGLQKRFARDARTAMLRAAAAAAAR